MHMVATFPWFALNTASDILIFIATAIVFIQAKDKALFRHRLYLLIIGISFLATGPLSIAGYSPATSYISEISIAQTLFWYMLLTIIVSEIAGIKRLKYLFLLVLPATFLLSLNPKSVLLLDVLAELLGVLSFFTLFILGRHRLKYAGFFGLAGSLYAILLSVAIRDFASASNFIFVRNALIVIGLANLVKFSPRFEEFVNPPKIIWSALENKQTFLEALKPVCYLVIYISVLNIALLFAAISMHELGHFVVGSAMGCRGESVLWDSLHQTPYTSMKCPSTASVIALTLGGGVFIAPFGLIFLLLRRYPEKNLGWIIYGLGVTMSAFDLSEIIDVQFIFYVTILLGAAIISIGESLLINSYISYSGQIFKFAQPVKKPKKKEVQESEKPNPKEKPETIANRPNKEIA
ncbi:Uncharacterised protein [uncultured archaeon]|nr:Uncharacterised protein [uncultured archaeon]